MKSNVWKFYFSTFFGSWSFATGFLVFYYRELGFSYFQIFIIAVTYEILNFLLEIPTGVLADLWGRKRVVVIGYLISGLSFFYVILKPEAYITFIFWSVLSAICTTLNSGSFDAFIYDTAKEIDPDYYPKVLGRISAIALVTQAISFPIGGWLADSLGFKYALILSGLGGLFQALIISTTKETPIKHIVTTIHNNSINTLLHQFNKQIRASFRILFDNSIVRLVLIYSIAFFVLSEFVRVISQPYLDSLGYSTKSAISFYSSCFLLMTAIASIISGHIKNSRNGKAFLIIISVGLSFPLLFLNFGKAGIAFLMVFYAALGAGQVVISDVMNRLIPSDMRATILSMQNQLGSISYAISAIFIGVLIDMIGIVSSALIMGAVILVVFSIILNYLNKTRHEINAKS